MLTLHNFLLNLEFYKKKKKKNVTYILHEIDFSV